MTGAEVRAARERRGWQQDELAERLGVSQGYVSLLESGRRSVPKRLAAKLVSLLSMSPSALPVSTPKPLPSQQAARGLGRLGYPGFAYLRSGAKVNPMEVLLGTLLADDVDARVVEGLPWLLVRYPDVDWDRLVAFAKQHEAQNRLGFLVALASRVAAAKGDTVAAELCTTYCSASRPIETMPQASRSAAASSRHPALSKSTARKKHVSSRSSG